MYAEELMENYAAVKARLYGQPKRPVVIRAEPKKLIAWDVPEADPVTDHPAPLTMIGLCSWRFLVALAAEKNGCKGKDVLSYSRVRNIAKARHEAAYLIASHTNYSVAQIARMMGRDHTSTMSSLRKFPKLNRKYSNHANKTGDQNA